MYMARPEKARYTLVWHVNGSEEAASRKARRRHKVLLVSTTFYHVLKVRAADIDRFDLEANVPSMFTANSSKVKVPMPEH